LDYKERIYKKFVDNGRAWYHIDKSEEPTEEERKIILEMDKQERQPNTYTVTEHDTNKTYTVTEHEDKKPEQAKPEMDTTTLLRESARLLQKQEPNSNQLAAAEPTEREKELQQSKKEWDRYYLEHPNERHKPFPKTFLDDFTNTELPNQNVNQIKRLSQLLKEVADY